MIDLTAWGVIRAMAIGLTVIWFLVGAIWVVENGYWSLRVRWPRAVARLIHTGSVVVVTAFVLSAMYVLGDGVRLMILDATAPPPTTTAYSPSNRTTGGADR